MIVTNLQAYRTFGFHGYGDDSVSTQMDTIVAQLRAAYWAGLSKIQAAHGTGVLDWVTGTSSESKSTLAAYQQLPAIIDKLDTTLRQQVISGKKADGAPYTFTDWANFAKGTVADAITKMADYSVDTGGWYVVSNTAVATINPSLWPTWMKVGVGAAVVLSAAYVANTFGLLKLFKKK